MDNNWQRWKGIMKCYPFEELRLKIWKPPYIVQPKYDGVRCRSIHLQTGPRLNETLLLSSEENVINSVPHINEELSRLMIDAELDGELYCHGMTFEQIVSITSRTVNIRLDHQQIKYYVFDIVNDQSQMRRALLIEKLRDLSPWIEIAPFWLCESLDEVLRVYDKLIEMEYEGMIVRNIYAPYVKKRSTFVMKFKPKQQDEYEIVGTQEEIDKDGNPKGTLGALICKSGDGNLFNVGTGFTDERRAQLWEIYSALPGRFATVKYQHVTSGRKVPRFPVFVEVSYGRDG